MSQTPILALPYPDPPDPADVPADMQALAERIEAVRALIVAGGIPAYTVAQWPPANPVDGQLATLIADAANGVKWLLRYNAGSPSVYKWESLGGSPLSAFVATAEALTVLNGTLSDLATVGPQVQVPRAGDYEWRFSFNALGGTAALAITGAMFFTGLAQPNAVSYAQSMGGAGGVNLGTAGVAPGVAANAFVKVQYAFTGAASPSFRLRQLRVMPVRIG